MVVSRLPVPPLPVDTAALADWIVGIVRAELDVRAPTHRPDDWVAVHERARMWSRREAAERCRAGQVPGAIKVGKTWCARLSDIDNAVRALAESPREAPASAPAAPAIPGAATLAELGLSPRRRVA